MKLISVIIPAYNVAAYISATLESLLCQLSDDIEIIVVDDGSTDNTVDLVEKVFTGQRLQGCKLLRQDNSGVSSARNAGLREASGRYVYFLDGDDYVSNNLFQTLRELLDDKPVDVCCWKFNLVNPDMTLFRTYEANLRKKMMPAGVISGMSALENILMHHSLSIWTGSAVYRRAFLESSKLSFYIGCQRGQDIEFIHKALLHAQSVRFIDKTLSFYLQREGSAVHSYTIRRFDAVCATMRTGMSLEEAAQQPDGRLGYILRYRRPVEDFLFVAAFFMIHYGLSSRELNRMIDSEYPALRRQINHIAAKDLKLFDVFRWIYLCYSSMPRFFVLCVKTFSRYQGV